jgi:hypothetical protein
MFKTGANHSKSRKNYSQTHSYLKIIDFFSEKAQKQGDRGEITMKTHIHC